MRQDHRTPFERALQRARAAAFANGDFAGQESFMTAGEIRALAARAGIGAGVSVLDVGCGVGGPGQLLARETGCGYLGADFSASAVAIARERAPELRFAVAHVPPLPEGPFEALLHRGERREPDRVGVGHGRALVRRERLSLLEREGEAAARRERPGHRAHERVLVLDREHRLEQQHDVERAVRERRRSRTAASPGRRAS